MQRNRTISTQFSPLRLDNIRGVAVFYGMKISLFEIFFFACAQKTDISGQIFSVFLQKDK